MLSNFLSFVLSLPIHFYRACISPMLPASCGLPPHAANMPSKPCASMVPLRVCTSPSGDCCAAIRGEAAATTPYHDPHTEQIHRYTQPRPLTAAVGRHCGKHHSRHPYAARGTYSVGIHPWDTAAHIKLSTLKQLVAMARDNRVVAIGEAGFDRMRGGDPACQAAVFDFQARLARRVGKPLIIHCVRAYDMLLAAARRHCPDPVCG